MVGKQAGKKIHYSDFSHAVSLVFAVSLHAVATKMFQLLLLQIVPAVHGKEDVYEIPVQEETNSAPVAIVQRHCFEFWSL